MAALDIESAVRGEIIVNLSVTTIELGVGSQRATAASSCYIRGVLQEDRFIVLGSVQPPHDAVCYAASAVVKVLCWATAGNSATKKRQMSDCQTTLCRPTLQEADESRLTRIVCFF